MKLHPIACCLAGVALAAAAHAQTAYPVPVDTNNSGQIDSSEIQAVINSATGIVYLPASNTYNIDEPLTITTSGITLLGEGHGVSTLGGTILRIANNIEGVVISNCNGSGLRHLSVVGPTGHTTNAIRIQGCTDAFLKNLRIASAFRGIELVNCTGPMLTDIAMKGHAGDYGLKVWGDGGGTSSNVQVTRINCGAASGNDTAEWMIVGPSVNGLTLQSSRFVGSKRGMRLTGSPGPTNVTTARFGCDNPLTEALLVESGSGLTMINTWIGQPNSSGVVFGSGYSGTANLTNLRIRGAYQHGLQIDGGSNINIWNPLIGANGTDPSAPSDTIAGIHLAPGVSNLRVTGGRIGPLYSQGGGAKQYFGIHYTGTTAQSDSENVKAKGPSLAGNGVPYAPDNLLTY